MRRLILLLLASLALSAGAAVTPLPGVTPQRMPALAPLPVPIAVRVTDSSGIPVAGAKAYLSAGGNILELAPAASGDCWIDFMTVLVCRVATDADGIARFPALATRRAETFSVRVSATNDLYPDTVRYGETTLQFTSDPLQEPARLLVTAGNDQRAVIGTALSPITVRLEDAGGQPKSQALLWYSPLSNGPGGFESLDYRGEIRTDDNGIAALPVFRAGWGLGEHQAEVRHFDPEAAAYVTAVIRYTATNAQGGSALALGDLWWGGPAESGWGLSVTQRGDRLFNVWFVYDGQHRPTWFVQSAGEWMGGVGATNRGALYWPRGTPWYAYDASRFVAGEPVGNGQVDFRGPEEAWTSFSSVRSGAADLSLNEHVVRQPFGGAEPGPVPGVGGLWWGGPSQNGWGVAVHEHGYQLFLVWFTYDAAGLPTWFVMPDGRWTDSLTHAGSIYRTTAPPITMGLPLDARNVRTTAVGAYRVRFGSTNDARMEVTIDGRGVTLELVRQVF